MQFCKLFIPSIYFPFLRVAFHNLNDVLSIRFFTIFRLLDHSLAHSYVNVLFVAVGNSFNSGGFLFIQTVLNMENKWIRWNKFSTWRTLHRATVFKDFFNILKFTIFFLKVSISFLNFLQRSTQIFISLQ